VKLDSVRMAGHPAVVLLKIRRDVRPTVMRVQRRWRRRAAYRQAWLWLEAAFMWTAGTLAVVLAVMTVVSILGRVWAGWLR
jgi:hypothetical protein